MASRNQNELPGMEDRKLKDLHDAALEYAEIRDQRMALSAQEVELKTSLLALMHKYKKESYVYDGIEINIVHEEETVKVKVKAAEKEAAA